MTKKELTGVLKDKVEEKTRKGKRYLNLRFECKGGDQMYMNCFDETLINKLRGIIQDAWMRVVFEEEPKGDKVFRHLKSFCLVGDPVPGGESEAELCNSSASVQDDEAVCLVLKKEDWVLTKREVSGQIIQTRLTLALHEAAVKLCDEELAKFK